MRWSSRAKLGRRAVLRGGLATLVALSAACRKEQAEDPSVFPTRPITILVPFPPGGGTDLAARAVSAAMAQYLGQPVVVENRGGANGAIAADIAAASKPDGYTLFLGNLGTLAITPNIMTSLRYDPVNSFAPISQISASSTILVVHPSVPAHTVGELVALCKRQPGALNYASSSPGTMLPMEMLKQIAGIDLRQVPYRGTGPAVIAVLAGHVHALFGGALGSLPHIHSGGVRALAVAGSRRNPALPDVPTIAESGYPNYAADSWNGLLAPAGTPDVIVDKLNRAVSAALSDPAVSRRMELDGATAVSSSPGEFKQYIAAEYRKWRAVVAGLPGFAHLR
jgi:tripartite-type tricarboxylate transporter receptor subunit TctC